MVHRDAITVLERTARRRFDDGTLDVAAGLLLFGLGASLDLGRPHAAAVVVAALVVFGARFLFVWPRIGFARATGRARVEAVAAFTACLALAMTIVLVLGVARSTGFEAESGWPDRVRLLSAATIWALAGFLAWIAHRRASVRFYGYAVAIAAAYLVGPLVGLDVRAWGLALLGLAFVGVGALRLRALRAANPPLLEDDPGGA